MPASRASAPSGTEPLKDLGAEPGGWSLPDKPDAFATRRFAVEGHLGFGTPVGELGLVTEYSPHPFLGLGAGIGIGSGPHDGNTLHGALLARLRPIRGKNNAFVLGAAYSFGGFRRFSLNLGEGDSRPPLADRTNWAHWAQFDLGWERRAEKGFLIRLSIGGAILLNPADLDCAPADAALCISTSSQSLVTFDLALGFAGPV